MRPIVFARTIACLVLVMLFMLAMAAALQAQQNVSGQKTIIADVTVGSSPVRGVQFTLDGANLGAEVTTLPYQYVWDTTKTLNGAHTLGAKATDTAGLFGTATPIQVNVTNSIPPTVTIRTPIAQSTVNGKTTVQASAVDADGGIANMTLIIGGSLRASYNNASSFSYNWNTSPDKKNSPVTIAVSARDKTGNSSSQAIVVKIQ